jgi:hypothetical protein
MEITTTNTVTKLQIRTDLLKFLNSAKSTDKLRYQLNYYHVQNGFIFCTDGRRAHRIKLSEVNPIGGQLEDGVYNLCTIEKTKFMSVCLVSKEEGVSPSLESVWPTALNQIRPEPFSFGNESMTITSRLLDIFSLTERALNIDFIKDLHYEKKFSIWNICVSKGFDKDNGKPLIFLSESGNVQALILPYKYNQV